MFDVFDPVSDRGSVYRALVSEARSSVGSLVTRTSLEEKVVRDVLGELERAHAAIPVSPDDEIWEAKRPDLVAATELLRYEDQRAGVHQAEAELTEIYRFARLRSTERMDVELINGRDAVFERFRRLQAGACRQVRAIIRPPYFWDETEIARQEAEQCRQMAAGINYRAIYPESVSDSPARNSSMLRTIMRGGSTRVLPAPPIKLTVVDDDAAILALEPPNGAGDRQAALLVHKSELLKALCSMFESLWQFAVPVNLAQADPTGGREREILTMMASGATDDAIARQLGVSRRTVVRVVSRLFEQLGATTRFQAGAQAARRGWL